MLPLSQSRSTDEVTRRERLEPRHYLGHLVQDLYEYRTIIVPELPLLRRGSAFYTDRFVFSVLNSPPAKLRPRCFFIHAGSTSLQRNYAFISGPSDEASSSFRLAYSNSLSHELTTSQAARCRVLRSARWDEHTTATRGNMAAAALEDLSLGDAPNKTRERRRRATKENIPGDAGYLSVQSMVAGTDQHGIRIRMFTAGQQRQRARLAGVKEYKYEGGTIPSTDEGVRLEGMARHGEGSMSDEVG